MRERILEALGPLVGKPLWASGRAADMQTFQFGARRPRTNRRGEPVEVGEWALHVQCAWHISGPEGVVVGSRDLYYPPGDDPYDEPPDFDWDRPGANRRDERADRFFADYASRADAAPVVEAVLRPGT